MKIMSFNVLCWGKDEHAFENRIPLVLTQIRSELPDILGVQEAHRQWMDVLEQGLPEYAYVGVGRDDGAREGEYSPVFYRKDRFTLLDSGTFWLSETPDVPSYGWGAACRRICSFAVLHDSQNGKTFAAVNTHLDHISELARVEGVKLVAAKLHDLGDMPSVCTGDFNTFETDAPYRTMTDSMQDSKYIAAVSDNGRTYHGFDNPDVKDSPIDFVFVSPGINVRRYCILREKINGQYPSDHYPVVSEIDF